MSCRNEVANSIEYTFCSDGIPPQADRMQAVLQGRFIDELSGNVISAQLNASSELEQIYTRVNQDGVAGLISNPLRRFPGLQNNSIDVDLTISARRYLQQSFTNTLGPFNTGLGYPADFPDFFAAIDLGNIGLHREATHIRGRCVQNNGINRTPVTNAVVTVTGIWHQFPASHVDPLLVVEMPTIRSLQQGLYATRTAGVDQVHQRNLQVQVGDEKTLLLHASPGQNQIQISDRVNLVAGQILAIDSDSTEQVEYIEVVSVDGASTATQAATITLAYPLIKKHRQSVPCVPVVSQAITGTSNITRDAIPGDQTLFLDAMASMTNTTVEISGSGTSEYHALSLYRVVSDAEGYFYLPPISRVAMMQLNASHAGPLADVDIIFSPDYEQFENRIDLIFG